MLRACGADEKERVARAIHKLKVAVHAVVPPVGLLDATNAPSTCESEIFHGHIEGKELDWRDKESDRGGQSEANGCFPTALGYKKEHF